MTSVSGRRRHGVAEVVTEHLAAGLTGGAVPCHVASLEHQAVVGEGQSPVDVLLDHDDRHARLSRARARPSKTASTTGGARPSDISSAIDELGRTSPAPGPARASAARRPRAGAPAGVGASARAGKISNARSMASRRAWRPRQPAVGHPQVVDHGEPAEHARGLGQVHHAGPTDPVGRPAGDVLAGEGDAALRAGAPARRPPGPGCSCPPRWRPAPRAALPASDLERHPGSAAASP